jgi:hypothetical protein
VVRALSSFECYLKWLYVLFKGLNNPALDKLLSNHYSNLIAMLKGKPTAVLILTDMRNQKWC